MDTQKAEVHGLSEEKIEEQLPRLEALALNSGIPFLKSKTNPNRYAVLYAKVGWVEANGREFLFYVNGWFVGTEAIAKQVSNQIDNFLHERKEPDGG